MKQQDDAPTPDPSAGLSPRNRRRALAWLGYGALGLGAAGAGLGYGALAGKKAPSAGKTVQHPLTALALQALDGSPVDAGLLLQGQVAVLNFWAPWCPPCVAELPLIDAQYGAIPTKTFQFLAIALDDLAPVQRVWRARNLPHIQTAVAGYAGMQLMQRLGNASGQLPFTVLLGADGAILHSHLGALAAADIAALWDMAARAGMQK